MSKSSKDTFKNINEFPSLEEFIDRSKKNDIKSLLFQLDDFSKKEIIPNNRSANYLLSKLESDFSKKEISPDIARNIFQILNNVLDEELKKLPQDQQDELEDLKKSVKLSPQEIESYFKTNDPLEVLSKSPTLALSSKSSRSALGMLAFGMAILSMFNPVAGQEFNNSTTLPSPKEENVSRVNVMFPIILFNVALLVCYAYYLSEDGCLTAEDIAKCVTYPIRCLAERISNCLNTNNRIDSHENSEDVELGEIPSSSAVHPLIINSNESVKSR